jgi:hypothetical protein
VATVGAGLVTGGGATLSRLAIAGVGKATARSFAGPAGVEALAGAVGRKGLESFTFLNGAKAGAFLSGYAQNTGETQNQLVAEGIDEPGTALMVGAAKAALDYASLHTMVSKAVGGAAGAKAAYGSFGQLITGTAKAVAAAAGTEFVTEGTQTLLDELAIKGHKPEYEINTTSIIDGALKGAIGGGGVVVVPHVAVNAMRMAGEKAHLPSRATDSPAPDVPDIASLLGESQQAVAELVAPSVTANPLAGIGAQPVIPADNAPTQDTAPEPIADIHAQLKATPQGEGNWFTAANAEQAQAAAAEQGKESVVLPDGSVAVGTPEVLAELPAAPTQADIAKLNGYVQTKEQAAADPLGIAVVEVRDTAGSVVRNQLVGKSIVDDVVAQQQEKFPHHTVSVTEPEAAVERRSQAVAVEAGAMAEPTPVADELKAKGADLASMAPAELKAHADSLGIDTSRFVAAGLGDAVVERMRTGLAASVPGNTLSRRMDSLSPLAAVLDMPVAELQSAFYDSKSKVQGRAKLHEAVLSHIKTKFGGTPQFAKAVDSLPAEQAEEVRLALGLKEKGGVSMGGLREEILARTAGEYTPAAKEEAAPVDLAAPKPQADVVRDAVFNTPLLRQIIMQPDGKVGDGNHIGDALDKIPRSERLRLESALAKMDIDLGGQNRAAFLDLLSESAVGHTTYGVGHARADDTVAGEDTTAEPVQTVEFDPSLLDSYDARFVQTVAATPLTEHDRTGFPSGMHLYLEAIARIVEAGENPAESALDAAEQSTLRVARAGGAVLAAAIKIDPTIGERGTWLAELAKAVGLTDELASKAAGKKVSAVTALQKLVASTDHGSGMHLLDMASRGNDLEASNEKNMESTIEAMVANPDGMIRGLVDTLSRMDVTDGLGGMLMYGHFDHMPRAEGAQLTASTNQDMGVGDRVSIDEGSMSLGEQHGSDEQFFRKMNASTIKTPWGWGIELSEGLLDGVLDSPVSVKTTLGNDGANLFHIPLVGSDSGGRVIDAVALGLYGQGKEHAPANAAEAASNFLTNLARLMQGPDNRHSRDFVPLAARVIPDNLVIYIHPVTGKGVTFGEALNDRGGQADARARQIRVQRELDDVSDALDAAAEPLDNMREALLAKLAANRNRSVLAEAISLWLSMLDGAKTKRPDRGTSLGKTFYDLGRQTKDGGAALGEAFDSYLGLLSKRKALAAESRVLSADGIKGGEVTDEQGMAGELRAAAQNAGGDARGAAPSAREVTHALRGDGLEGKEAPQGRMGLMGEDASGVEHSPYAVDPLRATSAESHEALADRVREARIAAYVAAIAEADATPKRKKGESVEDHADRMQDAELAKLELQKLQGEKAAPRTLASTKAVTERAKVLPRTGNDKVTNTALRDIVDHLRKIGVPLPELRIIQLGNGVQAEAEIERLGVTSGAAQKIRDYLGAGDSFYFVHAGVAHIVIAERTGENAAAHQAADLAHELGHAVKDVTWGRLTTEHRYELTAAVREAHKGLKGTKHFTPEFLHEWFANEFAKAVVAQAATLGRAGSSFLDRSIAALLRSVKSVWAAVVGTPAEQNPAFESFAKKLFEGGYRDVQVNVSRVGGQVRNASGVGQLTANHANAAALNAKTFWARGVSPQRLLARTFSMVYARIARYSPALSRALFQPANAESTGNGQSWQQLTRGIQGRMRAQVDALSNEIKGAVEGGKALRALAIQSAFTDAYLDNPATANGRKVRELIDALTAEAERSGLKSVQFGTGFNPVAFDRKAVSDRLPEFRQLMIDKLGVSQDEAREMISRIVDGAGTLEGTIAPGMPVGAHQTTLSLVNAMGAEAMHNGGWLLKKHEEALFHWVDGVGKRAAWEAVFGGTKNFEYSPNAKFNTLLDKVRVDHGDVAAAEVMDMVNGALGRHPAGNSMPTWLRSSQEFVTGWVGMTLLAFSGVASIPELALPFVRAGGRVGIGESVSSWGEAKQLARDFGIVISESSEQVMWQATGEQYTSPLLAKTQSLFFKYNGNEVIVRTARTLATSLGVRYLLNSAAKGDDSTLAQLNVDSGTIAAWDAAGRPAWSPSQTPEMQAISAKVSDALHQFVSEATLNPSRFQATHWGNNPWLKMAWQLKHFLYTYGDTVLGGIYREMKVRWKHLDPKQFSDAMAIALPALIFGIAVMPLAAGSLELRDWIRRWNGQKSQSYSSVLDYLTAVFNRSGGVGGPVEIVRNMRQQQAWGMSGIGALAPVAGKVETLFSARNNSDRLRALVPVASQNRGIPMP